MKNSEKSDLTKRKVYGNIDSETIPPEENTDCYEKDKIFIELEGRYRDEIRVYWDW